MNRNISLTVYYCIYYFLHVMYTTGLQLLIFILETCTLPVAPPMYYLL